MEKQKLLELETARGRTYKQRSGFTLERSLKALKNTFRKEAKITGVSEEEIKQAFIKGYNDG